MTETGYSAGGAFLFIFPHELSKALSYLKGFLTTAHFEAFMSKIPETQLQSLSDNPSPSQQASNRISFWDREYCFGRETPWNKVHC